MTYPGAPWVMELPHSMFGKSSQTEGETVDQRAVETKRTEPACGMTQTLHLRRYDDRQFVLCERYSAQQAPTESLRKVHKLYVCLETNCTYAPLQRSTVCSMWQLQCTTSTYRRFVRSRHTLRISGNKLYIWAVTTINNSLSVKAAVRNKHRPKLCKSKHTLRLSWSKLYICVITTINGFLYVIATVRNKHLPKVCSKSTYFRSILKQTVHLSSYNDQQLQCVKATVRNKYRPKVRAK